MVAVTRSASRRQNPRQQQQQQRQAQARRLERLQQLVRQLIARGPRSRLLTHYLDRHHRAGEIGLNSVRDALNRDAQRPHANPFPALHVDLAQALPQEVQDSIQLASDRIAALLSQIRAAVGDPNRRYEEVVAVFAQVGLLCVASAINEVPNALAPAPPSRHSRVISGATGVVAFDAQRTFHMEDPASIGCRPDAMLMRQAGPARPGGNAYLPLCVVEVKRGGARRLNDALAACVIDAAVIGHKFDLAVVYGIVTKGRSPGYPGQPNL